MLGAAVVLRTASSRRTGPCEPRCCHAVEPTCKILHFVRLSAQFSRPVSQHAPTGADSNTWSALGHMTWPVQRRRTAASTETAPEISLRAGIGEYAAFIQGWHVFGAGVDLAHLLQTPVINEPDERKSASVRSSTLQSPVYPSCSHCKKGMSCHRLRQPNLATCTRAGHHAGHWRLCSDHVFLRARRAA